MTNGRLPPNQSKASLHYSQYSSWTLRQKRGKQATPHHATPRHAMAIQPHTRC